MLLYHGSIILLENVHNIFLFFPSLLLCWHKNICIMWSILLMTLKQLEKDNRMLVCPQDLVTELFERKL